MFLCLSCQDINSDTCFLLMRKITACFHAVNTETVSMVSSIAGVFDPVFGRWVMTHTCVGHVGLVGLPPINR